MGGKPGVTIGGDPRGGVHVDPVRPPIPGRPRMAGSIRPVPPMGGGASPTGAEYRSVGDFRDFR